MLQARVAAHQDRSERIAVLTKQNFSDSSAHKPGTPRPLKFSRYLPSLTITPPIVSAYQKQRGC